MAPREFIDALFRTWPFPLTYLDCPTHPSPWPYLRSSMTEPRSDIDSCQLIFSTPIKKFSVCDFVWHSSARRLQLNHFSFSDHFDWLIWLQQDRDTKNTTANCLKIIFTNIWQKPHQQIVVRVLQVAMWVLNVICLFLYSLCMRRTMIII